MLKIQTLLLTLIYSTCSNCLIDPNDCLLHVDKEDKGAIAAWSFQALIVYGHDGNQYRFARHYGALIRPNLVITLAELVGDKKMEYLEKKYGEIGVRVGTGTIQYIHPDEIKGKDVDSKQKGNVVNNSELIPVIPISDKIYRVEEIIEHPNRTELSETNYLRNIALIRLRGEETNLRFISISRTYVTLLENVLVKVAGWFIRFYNESIESIENKKHQLQIEEFPLSNIKTCERTYFHENKNPESYLSQKLCHYAKNSTENIYETEKGMPLIFNNTLQGLFALHEKGNVTILQNGTRIYSYVMYIFEDLSYHIEWISSFYTKESYEEWDPSCFGEVEWLKHLLFTFFLFLLILMIKLIYFSNTMIVD